MTLFLLFLFTEGEERVKVIENLINCFSAENKPCYVAKPGETIMFKTVDCFTGQITSEDQFPTDEYENMDLATGPVYVEGAKPGDVLVVDILDVAVAPVGTTCGIGGPLADRIEQRTKRIPVKDNVAQFNDIMFHVDPMIGVIGVTPAQGAPLCFLPGNHGGNMDSKMIKKGSRIYFPVQVDGALLGMGDVHASQGDGELCGTGIEIDAEITVKVDVIKDFELNWPVTETQDKWYVNTCAPEYKQALDAGCDEISRLICDAYGWDLTDAFLYMSLKCDIEINQFTLPCPIDMNLRLGIPKDCGKELIKK